MAVNVRIRKNQLKDCKSNFYLDFYPPIYNRKTGKRTRYEYTKIWVYDDYHSETVYYSDKNGKKQSKIEILIDKKGLPKKKTLTIEQKHHNREAERMITIYQSQRLQELSKFELLSEEQIKAEELAQNKRQSFTEYFKKIAENSTSCSSSWNASFKYFEKFYGTIFFFEINRQLIEDFKKKLLSARQLKSSKLMLSNNSASSYFVRFLQCLETAYFDNFLSENLKERTDGIKEIEPVKEFLTLSECRKLFKTYYPNDDIVTYCKFSLLTGLRFSDIFELKWIQVSVSENGKTYINFNARKTKSLQNHPISDEAVQLMGERKNRFEYVFNRIQYHSLNNKIREWLSLAEIDKDITFHSFRSSYAVAQMEAGEDLYLISKLLGHKSINSTQIYAKISDKRKERTTENFKIEE